MDSSVLPEGEIWFLHVCHHISNAVYIGLLLSVTSTSVEWKSEQWILVGGALQLAIMTTQATSIVVSVDKVIGLNLGRDTHCQWPMIFVGFFSPYKLMLYNHVLPRLFQFMIVHSDPIKIQRRRPEMSCIRITQLEFICFRSYEMPRSWPCAWTIVAHARVTMTLGMAPECLPQYHIRSMPRNSGK
jgi:hypothetical protein